MCDWFDITQLFAVGLGLDIAGAYLLARGLLAAPEELARRTGSYYGSNPWAVVSAVQDKFDGVAGLWALLTGFGVQAVAYIVTLTTETSAIPSTEKAIVGAVGASVAIVFMLLVARWIRPRWVKRHLITIARFDESREANWLDHPNAETLAGFGKAMGVTPGQTEGTFPYIQRVFGVSNAYFREGDNLRLAIEIQAEMKASGVIPPPNND